MKSVRGNDSSGLKSDFIRARKIAALLALAAMTHIPAAAYANSCRAPDNNPAPRQYCEYKNAADAANEAAEVNDILWTIWLTVGVVCTTMCVLDNAGLGLWGFNQWCLGTSIGATGIDIGLTQDFSQNIADVAGLGAGAYMVAQRGESTSGNDFSSCVIAAMSFLKMYTKIEGAKNQRNTRDENLANAEKLLSQAQAMRTGGELAGQGGSGGNTFGSGAGLSGFGGGGGSGSTPDGVIPVTSGGCGSHLDAQARISCAVSSDTSLPDYVRHPKFSDDFKKISGQSLDEFVSGNHSSGPEAALSALTGGGHLNEEQARKMGELLVDYERRSRNSAPTDMEGSGYSSRGGGGGARKGSGGLDTQALVQNIMGQFMPQKQGAGKKASGVDAVAFAHRTRGPAAVAEDRKLSLFDRVTYRYTTVSTRVLPNRVPSSGGGHQSGQPLGQGLVVKPGMR